MLIADMKIQQKKLDYKTEQICINAKIQMLGEKTKKVRTLSK